MPNSADGMNELLNPKVIKAYTDFFRGDRSNQTMLVLKEFGDLVKSISSPDALMTIIDAVEEIRVKNEQALLIGSTISESILSFIVDQVDSLRKDGLPSDVISDILSDLTADGLLPPNYVSIDGSRRPLSLFITRTIARGSYENEPAPTDQSLVSTK